MRKVPQNKIDQSLKQLNKVDQKTFYELVKYNPPYRELREFFCERGITEITDMHLSTWWKRNRPRGDQAIALSQFAEAWEGLEPAHLLNASAGISAKIIEHLYEALSQEEIDKASIGSKLTNLAELLKELRQCSQTLVEMQESKDLKEIRLAGAYELADELRKVFKETPFEQALERGVEGALKKME